MHFEVSPECLALGLRAGAIVFRGLTIGPARPALRQEIAEALSRLFHAPARQDYPSLPQLVAFREILRKVGANPRREKPSAERLLSFAQRHNDLPAINNLVDAYNLLSVRHGCSLGAHDLGKIASPVSLRILTGSEPFIPLGKTQAAGVAAGEFGYVDGQRRLLCRLDLLQADFSKVTAATTSALLIIEGTVAHPSHLLRQVFAEALELVPKHCGGTGDIIAMPVQANEPDA